MIVIHNYTKYSPGLRIVSIISSIVLLWMLGISMVLVLFNIGLGFAPDEASFNHSFLNRAYLDDQSALIQYLTETARLKEDDSLSGLDGTLSYYRTHFDPNETNLRFVATDQNGSLLLTNDPDYGINQVSLLCSDVDIQNLYLDAEEYEVRRQIRNPAAELPQLFAGSYDFGLDDPGEFLIWYFSDQQLNDAYNNSFPAMILSDPMQSAVLFDSAADARKFDYEAEFGEGCDYTVLSKPLRTAAKAADDAAEKPAVTTAVQGDTPAGSAEDTEADTGRNQPGIREYMERGDLANLYYQDQTGDLTDFEGTADEAEQKTAVLVSHYGKTEQFNVTLPEYYNYKMRGKYVRAESEQLESKLSGSIEINVRARRERNEIVSILYYLPADMPVDDQIRANYQILSSLFAHSEGASASMFLLLVLTVISCILMCTAAGHKPYSKELHVTHIHRMPFELFWLLPLIALLAALFVMRILYSSPYRIVAIFSIGMILCIAAFCILWLYTTAVRIKTDSFWSSFGVIRLVERFFRLFRNNAAAMLLTGVYVIVLGAVNVIFMRELMPLILIVDILTLLGILYCVYAYCELRRHAEAIAKGDYSEAKHPIPLRHNFAEFDRSLNGITDGVEAIVEKQLKAEHLRTELITNVSHDLKTPLTSIVNYVDLLSREPMQSREAAEYLDVLRRQAARLKKLTIDLVDASKASTGNLTVELVPTNIQVLIGQITGEYEEQLAQHGLTLVQNIPEEPLTIMADGRQIWRVFDNLLNNACKYALSGTRVYLDVSVKKNMLEIMLKNISATPLNISADELMERFVRGDSSRHTEGSGLGLSIARDLTVLQNGLMNLSTDGDLFKASLTFPLLEEKPAAEPAPEAET